MRLLVGIRTSHTVIVLASTIYSLCIREKLGELGSCLNWYIYYVDMNFKASHEKL